jgi:peptidyl-prolyl cis-trans isomerase SurA
MNKTWSSSHRAATLAAIVILTLLAVLAACTREPASGREVYAEVDGKPLYRDQVERYYRSRVATGSAVGGPEQALSFKLSILNELINNQILMTHASRARIAVSEAEVDTKVAELQSPYGKEEFDKRLKDQGLTMNDLRSDVRQSLIINKLVNKEILSRITVSDADIAAYYERNKATFNITETQYHLAQIEVTPTSDPEVRNLRGDDAKNPQAAQRKIEALYARLRSGEDFATVAQEYSEDPRTAAGGGDMGFIPVSALNSNTPLKRAITALKVGQITGIIRTSDGYHILKLLGQEEAGQRELSDPKVHSAIRQGLMNEREQLFKAAYIEDLRDRSKVVNYLAQKITGVGGDPTLVK